MTDFFNDFDKVNKNENPQPATAEKPAKTEEKEEKTEEKEEKTEEKEDTNDFSKTLENLRNEISALKELLKNNSSADEKIKTESEENKE